MKGDFSKTAEVDAPNDLGILYQQGRVIRDADLTAGELIAERWRETAARDVIGANVAAVPATEPDGYFVEAAAVHGGHVDVRLRPGRIWADGVHLVLPEGEDGPPTFAASYLEPPANPAGVSVDDIDDGVRDAVILEVSIGALNGFQVPERLIESALGGPDTAERIHPRQRLRLLRLGPGEDCRNIGPRLRDDLGTHGRLSVTLEPPTVVAGDCPIVEGGGYSGFEHNLYRIEIAQTDGAAVMFKWSSMNGGLVGRGRFEAGVNPQVIITANREAILNSGLTEFYLEALTFNEHRGFWEVVYGTPASLNADGEIDLTPGATFGTIPGAASPVFFRLWNGIEPIADYTGGATPFRDGIRLDFSSGAGSYVPEDFWTFDLRAGEIANEETLHDNAPPEGPQMRRVPLAEISWTGRQNTDVSGEIEDCRRRFRPLTNQKLCCTYLVGNGVTSHGDFNSLEEAVAHLPPGGGKICLLPGIHMANLSLVGRSNVAIHGCRNRTMLLPRLATAGQPVISVEGGREIDICDLDFFAPFGMAIDVAGTQDDPVRGLRITGCRVLSLTYGFRIEWVHNSKITDNYIWLLDHVSALSAISLRATDTLVEKNVLGVWPYEFKPPLGDGDDPQDPPDPADPCIEPDDLYGNIGVVVGYVLNAWLTIISQPPVNPYRARGGLHLRGACARVDVIRNRIDGGLSHGISLGGLYQPELPDDDGGDDVIGAASGPAPFVFTIQHKIAGGFARLEDGSPVIGLALTVRDNTSGTIAATAMTTPPDGLFKMDLHDGVYQVETIPGYEIIDAVETQQGDLLLTVRRIEVEDRPDAAFLYQIRILDNKIERMGLSGIGFLLHSDRPAPPLLPSSLSAADMAEFVSGIVAPRELIGTTNLVRDLVIRGNRIQDNLNIVFNEAMRALATLVAQGGISLALVEGVRIERNHIVRNGPSAASPCAGVFVGYGEEVIVSDNYIAANGPVGTDYDATAIQGLRGGIVVRMASAVVAGGERDAQQRPALDIRNNHIDQPAGRAITAFVFGPVTCVGNHLNAEREGRWGLVDALVGAVMIVNLGGLHRHFDTRGLSDFTGGAAAMHAASAVGLAAPFRAEALLPGGEILFNSNRIRTGGDNAAYTSQLIVTADDLGYDANQSAVFKSNMVFSNLVSIAQSQRVTDNRFRERAPSTAMSALTFSFGLSLSGRWQAMNITTQNQADHCILAGTNGRPVVDTPNLVVHDMVCPVDDPGKLKYLMASIFVLIAANQGLNVDPQADAPMASESLAMAAESSVGFQDEMLMPKAAEAARLENRYGAEHVSVAEAREELRYRLKRGEILKEQAALARIDEVEAPETGMVLDGRVLDAEGLAVKGATVALVDGRGRALAEAVEVDNAGYYAVTLDEKQYGYAQAAKGLSLKVVPPDGKVKKLAVTAPKADDERKIREIVSLEIAGRGTRGEAPVVGPGKAGLGDVSTAPRGPAETRGPDGLRRKPQAEARPGERPGERPGAKPGKDAPADAPASAPQKDVEKQPAKKPEKTPSKRPGKRPGKQPEGQAAASTPARGIRVSLVHVEGVGPKIAARLRAAGLRDADALASADADKLREVLGPRGEALRKNAMAAIRKVRRTKG